MCACVHTHLIFQLVGILQFTDPESETYLGQFCREEINLSDASNVKILEYMRTLVDGAHWSAQKQLEKPNQTGRGGHLGCSNSFNFNFYKKYFKNEVRINSQGREQLHSIVDASCKSLRQFNYNNYMTFLKFFFAVTNLKNRGMN